MLWLFLSVGPMLGRHMQRGLYVWLKSEFLIFDGLILFFKLFHFIFSFFVIIQQTINNICDAILFSC